MDNGAYATVVYEAATAALLSYQRQQAQDSSSPTAAAAAGAGGEVSPNPAAAATGKGELGIVTSLSDTGSLDERAAALNAFREGKAHILVCSDIAARGLDVPNVSHVFQVSVM